MGENIISCERVQQVAVPWLEGQLAPAELELIGAHLERCEQCSTYIAQLDLVDLRPPRIHHAHPSRKLAYWDEMDTQLQSEMGRHYDSTMPSQSSENEWPKSAVVFLAASLLLSLFWGIQQQQRVEELHSQLQQQAREIERMERMFSSPPQPIPNAQYSVHVPARMEL